LGPRLESIERFRQGDARALDELYREESPRLGRFLLRYVRSREVAEDLLQEVWIQAWRSRGQLRDPERFIAWFYRIARNAVFQVSRKRQQKLQLVIFGDLDCNNAEGTHLTPEQRDPGPDPRRQAESAEMQRLLQREVDRLKPPAPEILALRFGSGLGLREIAEVLNLPLGTVCSLTSRSLKSVRESLEKQGLHRD
jgi:RNA polymerase sigma factor (sigma-70 family)